MNITKRPTASPKMKGMRTQANEEIVNYQMESSWTRQLCEQMPVSRNTTTDYCFDKHDEV